MNKERAITYSFLAHIRNSGTLAKGPIDIFIPLIKRALSNMNSVGIFEGKSLLEIQSPLDTALIALSETDKGVQNKSLSDNISR